MEELILLENPYSGSGYRNPSYVRPYSYFRPSVGKRVRVAGFVRRSPGERNPKGGVMKNVVSTKAMANWFQGVDMMDAGAAIGSLIATSMVPAYVVKDISTQTGKLLRVLACLGTTAVCGMLFQKKSSAAKAAVLGGLAGTGTQIIGLYTDLNLGKTVGGRTIRRQLPPGNPVQNKVGYKWSDVPTPYLV